MRVRAMWGGDGGRRSEAKWVGERGGRGGRASGGWRASGVSELLGGRMEGEVEELMYHGSEGLGGGTKERQGITGVWRKGKERKGGCRE